MIPAAKNVPDFLGLNKFFHDRDIPISVSALSQGYFSASASPGQHRRFRQSQKANPVQILRYQADYHAFLIAKYALTCRRTFC